MKIITFYNRLFCRKEIRNFLDDLVSDKLVSYLEYRGWFTSYFEVYCDEGSEQLVEILKFCNLTKEVEND